VFVTIFTNTLYITKVTNSLRFLMTSVYKILITVLMLAVMTSCKKPESPGDDNNRPKNLEEYYMVNEGLKDYFAADYFDMGMAIAPEAVDDPDDMELMIRHCSSLTAENVMKWSTLQPTEGTFNFSYADKIVNFAIANAMKVRGHTLCWHQQVPSWIFEDNGQAATKELVLERLRTHIQMVVTHFKGKVYAWDVVNEAIDDGSGIYKPTTWYNICGDEYIIEAFKAAREADPDAKLFYNDYSATQPTKSEKIFDLLEKLKNQDLVDGLGMEGHWNIDAPASETITAALNKYGTLGIEIHITEMDVSVYPNTSDPQVDYTTSIESSLAAAYSRFFNLFRSNRDYISSVTFWGITDAHSWLNNWPIPGRTNYPLLFNSDHEPKKVYFWIIDF